MTRVLKGLIVGLLISLFVLSACREDGSETLTPSLNELNQPLPTFLDFVAPSLQEKLSLTSYRGGEHYSHSPLDPPQGAQSRICFGVEATETLLEFGDHFKLYPDEGEYLPDRIALNVDGQYVERTDEVSSLLMRFDVRKNDDSIVASAPEYQLFCYLKELGPGSHAATIEFRKTSGEIVSYSWSFTLLTSKVTPVMLLSSIS